MTAASLGEVVEFNLLFFSLPCLPPPNPSCHRTAAGLVTTTTTAVPPPPPLLLLLLEEATREAAAVEAAGCVPSTPPAPGGGGGDYNIAFLAPDGSAFFAKQARPISDVVGKVHPCVAVSA
eukprot:GHVS01037974.1.p1 GENE.GHVS01037974.1~~GHVS01037974.1.p1  ORF type:complete len:121 (-),score=41.56 GHVS01037974.1:73-435(-)